MQLWGGNYLPSGQRTRYLPLLPAYALDDNMAGRDLCCWFRIVGYFLLRISTIRGKVLRAISLTGARAAERSLVSTPGNLAYRGGRRGNRLTSCPLPGRSTPLRQGRRSLPSFVETNTALLKTFGEWQAASWGWAGKTGPSVELTAASLSLRLFG